MNCLLMLAYKMPINPNPASAMYIQKYVLLGISITNPIIAIVNNGIAVMK